jgi:ABC-type bacteriocin/lantibiotic exporter with double-glycine peptidase domain
LDNDYYIGVLGGIGAVQALSSLARNLCFFVVCTHGSRVIHRSLFDAVLHANMRFYDTTNSGALINRFAQVRNK